MILVIRIFALVTLVVSPEVLERAIVPVVPHGTVTMVDALMEPSSPVLATVVADSEPGMMEPPESSPIESVTLLPLSGSTLALY